jgi:serine/threonine protein kinase/Tfp pilus assembly protein PilF
MSNDDRSTQIRRLDDLLVRWEESRAEGREIAVEELCPDSPALAAELAVRIAALRQMDALLASASDETAAGIPPIRSGASSAHQKRESATARAEYHDLRFHAAGALGEVFMAHNSELNREVALKFLKPSRAREPEGRRRFLREAEVTGRLEHPGVVPIYALGADAAGAPCYAMRFIRGETLQNAIDAFHAAEKPGRDPAERSLGLRELLARFVSICSTVGYAHSRGILHRDLKPRNVMLGKYDETLVVDWGLAKPFEPDQVGDSTDEEPLTPSSGDNSSDTPTVGVVGTLAYMSPEQGEARWDIVGPPSDIFSLGAILYAILTGKSPYGWHTRGDVLDKVKRCEFPKLRQIKPEAPRALEAICLKAMAREPAGRYATALELADDVKRWLADQPVAAWREPMALRGRRWMRRHRSLVTSAAAVLALGVFGLAGFASVVAGKNRELDEQRQRALAREALAIDAVKKFRDAIQDNPELKNRGELEALHKALLKEPMEFFRKLRDQLQADRDTRPDALAKLAGANLDLARTTREIGSADDALRSCAEAIAILERLVLENPTVRQFQNDLADAQYRLGYLQGDMGRPTEAMDSFRLALRIRERLARDHPTVAEYQSNLAASHNQIGNLLAAAGRPLEAMDSYQRALRISERLAGDHPAIMRYQNELALCYHNIGNRLDESGNPALAMESYRRAVAIEQRLVNDNPTETRLHNDLADSHFAIANLLSAAGRQTEALASYRLALEIQERLVSLNPTVNEYQDGLARSCNNIGDVLNETGHPTEAMESFRRALAIRERLARDNPSIHTYQGSLGIALANVAEAEMAQGRWDEARTYLDRAIERQRAALTAMPDNSWYQSDLKVHLLDLTRVYWAMNQPAEAHRVMRELIALTRGNPSDLYKVACALAVSVPTASADQRPTLGALAVFMLKEAVAAGWNDAGKTSRERDLAPLRDRDDFRRLLAELFDGGFPADPFAR